jgi:hypothetical protein
MKPACEYFETEKRLQEYIVDHHITRDDIINITYSSISGHILWYWQHDGNRYNFVPYEIKDKPIKVHEHFTGSIESVEAFLNAHPDYTPFGTTSFVAEDDSHRHWITVHYYYYKYPS